MAKKWKNFKFGSVISGIGLGVLLGIWANLIYEFPYSQWIYLVVFIAIFGTLGVYRQRTTETMAYAVSIYVFLQMAWDYAVLDRGEIRMALLTSASILMLLNILTGHYNIVKPFKILGKALGTS